MQVVYNVGIHLLGLTFRIAALFNAKAKKWVNGRKNYFNQLPNVPSDKQVIWFHCASLGEFDQGLPLMTELQKQENVFLLVTFFSPSGMEFHHKRNHHADAVVYLPLDTPSNARKFIAHFKPTSAFFIKYEFWSNVIHAAYINGTKLYNVSGLFRENQRFFKWHGGFFRRTLSYFDWFFVQNECSLQLLKIIGINRASVTGDSRYDRVLENKKQLTPNPILAQFAVNQTVFVAGSTWPDDVNTIADFIRNTTDRVIIAPHNIDEKTISTLVNTFGRKTERYSHIQEFTAEDTEIIILDTIGHLSHAYSYGNYAYVGGGFSGSLHNILEPAVFGLPVVFGPKHSRFPEAEQFVQAGFGFSVATSTDFQQKIECIKTNESTLNDLATEFVEKHAGSTQKILKHLNSN